MKKNIYQTATAVTMLSVMERTLGFLYRVALSRMIGAEGLGIYQIALSVFSVFVTFGTGGIPVTVSRLTTKNKALRNKNGEYASLFAGVVLSLLFTLPVFLFVVICKNSFGFLFSDKRCLEVFYILIFGLVLTSLYAVIRGSFWGNKEFLLTSVFEIVEEAVMVIVGICLIQRANDAFHGAKLCGYAVVISYIVSFSLSVIFFFIKGGKFASPKTEFKPLFQSAMPITTVRFASSLIGSAVAIILPAMLIKYGYTESKALSSFGVVSGMVIPILSIPSTVIGSISLVLVPELSEDYYKGNTERLSVNVSKGLFSSSLVACFLIPFFLVLGKDLGSLVYSNEYAGIMISRCAVMLLPMSLSIISTGILNSVNHEKQTLVFYFIGAVFMILSVFFLPKYIGSYAYPIGNLLSLLVTAILNLCFLFKKIPCHGNTFQKILPCLISILPVTVIGKLALSLFNGIFGFLLSILFTSFVMLLTTFALYFLFGILKKSPVKKIFFVKT